MEEALLKIVATINTYLTDYVLIILLIGTGILFTVRTRFVQVRCFGEGMKKVFGNMKLRGGKQAGGLSSFQALATAIAAQVGTGNIVGASGAILTGGPGAIFWMWIIAFLGMATIYAEAVLAQKTRVTDENGEVYGGPVYYIKKAFSGGFGKFLAVFIILKKHLRANLVNFWQAFSAWRLYLRLVLWAVWCSRTPLPNPVTRRLVFPRGWLA